MYIKLTILVALPNTLTKRSAVRKALRYLPFPILDKRAKVDLAPLMRWVISKRYQRRIDRHPRYAAH